MTNRLGQFKKMGDGLLSYALDSFFGSNVKGEDKQGNFLLLIAIIIFLVVCIVLLYAGVETVFLLTRKKFGSKGVKKTRAVLSALAFLCLSYFCYNSYRDYYGEVVTLGSEDSFWYASITFLFVGVVVLLRGLMAGGKDDSDVIDPMYRGSSWLLGGLVKEGVKQSTVQDTAEPILFLALGFFLFSYNYVWGLPFMFCAISCWFHLIVESAWGFFGARKELSNEGLTYAQNRAVNKVM